MPRDPKPPLAEFSPDSNYQVTLTKGADETEVVQIFAVTDLTTPLITSSGKSIVTSLAFTPNSRFFTIVRDGGIVENYEFMASSQQIVSLKSCSSSC